MKDKLQIKAAAYKKEASALLKKSELIELLSRFGKIHFTGSYAYNLMLNPDIDIYLETKNPTRETVKKILDALIDQDAWNGYMFYDWKKFRRPQFPKSYYIGLKIDWLEKRWKVDIWLFNQIPKKLLALEKRLQTSGGETHLKILKQKERRNKTRSDKSSFEIYQEFFPQLH
ncbi:MAG: nucleotidyltransferase domain-containing protein [Patescibacteria group bacterium]